MKKIIHIAILIIASAPTVFAQTAPDAAELTKLLNDFLAGASRSDAAIHDRFWADDLIYTRSAGRRVSKADVMRDVSSAPAPKPGDPTTAYTAEDVRIQQYGDMAIVAFRLVGVTKNGANTLTSQNLNTGTFLKRNGIWQVVAWQSTRMPRNQQESKEQVRAAEIAFQRAMLGADDDIRNLESIVADSFLLTNHDGTRVTRQQLIDDLRSGKLRYSKLEIKDSTVAVYGDTAVARGIFWKQRRASSSDTSPAAPEIPYTLTLTNQGNLWKVVAMHTSGRY